MILLTMLGLGCSSCRLNVLYFKVVPTCRPLTPRFMTYSYCSRFLVKGWWRSLFSWLTFLQFVARCQDVCFEDVVTSVSSKTPRWVSTTLLAKWLLLIPVYPQAVSAERHPLATRREESFRGERVGGWTQLIILFTVRLMFAKEQMCINRFSFFDELRFLMFPNWIWKTLVYYTINSFAIPEQQSQLC